MGAKRLSLNWHIVIAGVVLPVLCVIALHLGSGSPTDAFPINFAPAGSYALLLLGVSTLLWSAIIPINSSAAKFAAGAMWAGGLMAFLLGVVLLPFVVLAFIMLAPNIVRAVSGGPYEPIIILGCLLGWAPFWTALEVSVRAKALCDPRGPIGAQSRLRVNLGFLAAWAFVVSAEIGHQMWRSSHIERLTLVSTQSEWGQALKRLHTDPLHAYLGIKPICRQLLSQFPIHSRVPGDSPSYEDLLNIPSSHIAPIVEFLGPDYQRRCARELVD